MGTFRADSGAGGEIHRGWFDLKAELTGGSEEVILNDCERGEDYAKSAYIKDCEEPLPADIADIVRQQSQSVLAARNRIRDLHNVANFMRPDRVECKF